MFDGGNETRATELAKIPEKDILVDPVLSDNLGGNRHWRSDTVANTFTQQYLQRIRYLLVQVMQITLQALV